VIWGSCGAGSLPLGGAGSLPPGGAAAATLSAAARRAARGEQPARRTRCLALAASNRPRRARPRCRRRPCSNDAFDATTGVDKTKRESVVNLTGSRRGVLLAAKAFLAAGLWLLAAAIGAAHDGRVAAMLAAAIACGYLYQGPPFRWVAGGRQPRLFPPRRPCLGGGRGGRTAARPGRGGPGAARGRGNTTAAPPRPRPLTLAPAPPCLPLPTALLPG
jgi:hypothetical protein